MASEPLSAVLLMGLGYRTLSVAPPALPLVKWVVRTVPLPSAARGGRRRPCERAARPTCTERPARGGRRRTSILRLFDPHAALPRPTGAR